MKFNELLLEHIKKGNNHFSIDEYDFRIGDYYKYRDPYPNGCLIFLVKKNVNYQFIVSEVRDIEIPIFWFNLEEQRFNIFYGSRARDCGRYLSDLKYFNIKDFKHFKKIQKKFLNPVNEMMQFLCFPLKFILERKLPEKGLKEKRLKL